jgi:hypothetical protein
VYFLKIVMVVPGYLISEKTDFNPNLFLFLFGLHLTFSQDSSLINKDWAMTFCSIFYIIISYGEHHAAIKERYCCQKYQKKVAASYEDQDWSYIRG